MQHGADGDQISGALYRLVGGVASIQIREHEHGGLAGNRRVRCLGLGHVLHDGGIVLQRTVDDEVGALGLGQFGRFTHFLYVCAGAGGAGGVGDHGHTRLDAEGGSGVGGLDGDLGQLLGSGVRIDRAVTVDQYLIRQQHEEDGGDQGRARGGLDDLHRRTDGVGSGVHRAGYQTVDFVALQHHGTQYHVVFQLFAGNHFGHALVLAQLDQTGHIALAHGNRIDDLDAVGQYHALLFGDATDLFRVAQQHRTGDATLGTDGGSLDGARLFPFRQHDALVGLTGQLGQLVTEGRRAQATGAGGLGGERLDPVLVDVAGHIVLHQLDTLAVIFRDVDVEVLQADGGLPGVGAGDHDRQAGSHGLLAQRHHLGFRVIVAGQQQGAQLDAVHGGEAGGDDDVGTVAGGDQQAARTEVLDHVVDGAGAEGHGLQTAAVQLTLVQDLGGQVLGEILGARGDQLGVPGDAAEDAQRALAEYLQYFQVVSGVGAVVMGFEHLGQVGAGHAVLVNRCTHLVDDAAHDAGVADATEVGASKLDALFQLLAGVVARVGHEHHVGVQRLGDVVVQLVGKRLLVGRHHAFDDQHFGTAGLHVLFEAGHDLFQQDVGVAGGDHVLGVGEGERLGRVDVGSSADHGGGTLGTGFTRTRLSDRFEEADIDTVTFHGANDAKAHGSYADTSADRDKHNSACHFIPLVHFLGSGKGRPGGRPCSTASIMRRPVPARRGR